LPLFITGLKMTVILSACGILVALPLGLFVGLGRVSKYRFFNLPASIFMQSMRNTPSLIKVYLVYFGLPYLGISFSAFICGVIVLSIHTGSFMAEIFRASIESVSIRQMEASRALGFGDWHAMRFIILPQAIARAIPALGNEIVQLIKNSSILAVISVEELTYSAIGVAEQTGATYEVFTVIGFIYLFVNLIASLIIEFFERKLRVVTV